MQNNELFNAAERGRFNVELAVRVLAMLEDVYNCALGLYNNIGVRICVTVFAQPRSQIILPYR